MRFAAAFSAFAALSVFAAGCGFPEARQLESEVSEVRAPSRPTHAVKGQQVNVRNQRMQIIGQADNGEKVAVTGREMPGVEGLTFAEVYFFEAPQGFGWIAKKYLSPLNVGPVPVEPADIVWDADSLAAGGSHCSSGQGLEVVPSGSVLSYLLSGFAVNLSGQGSSEATCTLKMFASIPRSAYGALAFMDADFGLVKSAGATGSLQIKSRWRLSTPRGPVVLELPSINRSFAAGEEMNVPARNESAQASTRQVLGSLCPYGQVGGVFEVEMKLQGRSRPGESIILNMDGLNANWIPEFSCP